MATFKNKNFTKRDYEATNIVACVADDAPATPDNRWIETDMDISNLSHLWTQADVRFYGYL